MDSLPTIRIAEEDEPELVAKSRRAERASERDGGAHDKKERPMIRAMQRQLHKENEAHQEAEEKATDKADPVFDSCDVRQIFVAQRFLF